MTGLPPVLEPLAGIREELIAILELLDQEPDPTTRADLATELVGAAARYEDVKSRVVYPALREMIQESSQVDQAEADQEAVRDALADIRHRTQNVKPSNVHTSDPEGFELMLDRSTEGIREHLDYEDRILLPMFEHLESPAANELRDAVQQAVDHASSHPHPPHNAVARAIGGVVEKLNRNVHDESTVSHTEIEQLHDDLDSAADSE